MIKQRNLTVFGGLTLLLGCATFQPDLPSITEGPTGRHISGKVVWHDLITDVPAESRRFYEELFGWQFESVGNTLGVGDDDAYSLIRNNGRLIGGMIDANRLREADEDIAQWVTVVSVADVDGAAAAFESRGGTVLTAPTDLETPRPDRDRCRCPGRDTRALADTRRRPAGSRSRDERLPLGRVVDNRRRGGNRFLQQHHRLRDRRL